jgi:hypothetical protein
MGRNKPVTRRLSNGKQAESEPHLDVLAPHTRLLGFLQVIRGLSVTQLAGERDALMLASLGGPAKHGKLLRYVVPLHLD